MEIPLLHMWCRITSSPASDSTYYNFNGCGNETPSDLHLLIADRGDRHGEGGQS